MSVITYYQNDWSVLLRDVIDDAPPLTITVHRWLPTDDDIYGSLYGPQALAARMFGRIDPHWYLGGGSE